MCTRKFNLKKSVGKNFAFETCFFFNAGASISGLHKGSRKKYYFFSGPASMRGGGCKTLVSGPLKENNFFDASLSTMVSLVLGQFVSG